MGRMGRCAGAVFLLCAILAPAGCSQNHPRHAEGTARTLVRVRILENQDQVTLSASEAPTVTVGSGRPQRLTIPPNITVPVRLDPSGSWQIGAADMGAGELAIQPAAVGSVSINGDPYRGTFRLVPVGAGRFDVVNHVQVDDYLMSVVPKEMPRDWHLEAYKAQAIAARTYALYVARTSGSGHYDLHNDVRSQVYGGLHSETDKSRRAVNETAGIVVAYGQGRDLRIFKAYFSACCGGISQSAYDAFGDAYSEPLSEQNVGNTCNACPRFNWGPVAVRKDELANRFRAWGARRGNPIKDMGSLITIRVAATNRFRRPVKFDVFDSKGLRYTLGGEELRWAVNTDASSGTTLSSSFCSILDSGDTIQFVDGHGFGHGVGMCQWCAQARAEAGWAHEDIVVKSYPLSKLVRAY